MCEMLPPRMFVHRYTLRPKAPLNSRAAGGVRHGALLRAGNGYADVHPWPELGDAPLDDQLELLARGRTTALTARSLDFAAIDAGFREAGRSAFDGLQIPASHFPAGAGNVPPGFDTVKIKCGPGFDPDGLRRFAGLRLRLDFNATLTSGEFMRLAVRLPVETIDFVEDPSPYDPDAWASIRQTTGIRLALDRGSAGSAVDVLVVKPAVQNIEDVIGHASGEELVVTSYMDHAFGQMCAAWVAARHASRLSARCGLFTHVLFERDAFFERVESDGQNLLPPGGTGFGFDDLLQNLPWVPLT